VVTVLSLSRSACIVERSSSQQKNIHSPLRDRSEHSRVKKLMYLYWNLRLLDNMPLEVVDMFSPCWSWTKTTTSSIMLAQNFGPYFEKRPTKNLVWGLA
jgi:hypothetical protein